METEGTLVSLGMDASNLPVLDEARGQKLEKSMLDGLYYASKAEAQGVDLKKDSSWLIRVKFIPTAHKETAAD